ncbi:uncharacterized protein [Zea mays]|uniref:Uncharacterized protein n=1 Tax=Zea mays TaxID=4577 RepID=A0A804LWA8_MAIZE|nr:uncharacterized protein LOC103643270 isoform X2 [Zea mays]|eukprot:XP_008664656.1 uncharacterized protein LOC103643270 isoform X2 [Zea mays]
MGSSAAWSFRSRVVVGYLLRSTLEKRVSPAVTIDGLRERNSLPELLCMVRRRTGECKLMNVWSGDRISTQKKQSAALTGVPFTQQPKRLPATGRVSSASSFRRRCDRIGQRLQFNSRSATRAEASSA